MTRPSTGKVSLVGAGPWDPGLLTLRGRRCLERCDVVIYDNLSNPALLAFTRPEAEIIFAGKHGTGVRLTQEKISALMLARARAGKWVVRLKGGDPFIFGRGGEEAFECVRAGIPFEVVPGVTSAIGGPAYAGIPLTHRDYASTVTFVTGHESEKAAEVSDVTALAATPDMPPSTVPWEALARQGGTLVLFMSVLQLGENLRALTDAGLDPSTPAALVRWGTASRQEVLIGTAATLPALAAERRLRPPAVVVLGDVVRLAPELSWFQRRPLFGKRIVVTRARAQAGTFASLLEDEGAEVIPLPTIRIVPPESWAAIDRALGDLQKYTWLVFTSENGVATFFDRLRAVGRDVRELAGVAIAAIGPATRAAIEARGLRVALTPATFRGEAVAEALVAAGVAGGRVLLARAAQARPVLPERLAAAGAHVDEVALYRTELPPEVAAAAALFAGDRPPDLVTFTSSSTVTNFAKLFPNRDLPELLRGVAVGCIGPITAATARELGLAIDIEPATYTITAFAEAIVTYFQRHD